MHDVWCIFGFESLSIPEAKEGSSLQQPGSQLAMPSSCSSWTTSAYISSRLRDIALWPYSGHDSRVWPFRITWRHRSRDRLIPIGHFLSVVLWSQASLSLTVSEVFNVECNAMVDMTLIRPLNKGQGHSFGTNRFLIYDFLFVLCVDIGYTW